MTNRLQLQLVFTLLAAVSVAALSIVLIEDALRNAESAVLNDTRRVLNGADAELGQQLEARVASDSSWAALPTIAQEVSLRGVSQTVLRSYPGVEGGFYIGSTLAGYSFPTHDSGPLKVDLPAAEHDDIMASATEAGHTGDSFRLIRGKRDLVAIQSHRYEGFVAWSMKRLPGVNDPDARRRKWMLTGLVIAALFSIAGTLGTVFILRRGIAQIQSGLRELKSDFSYKLPRRKDELGEISDAINEMADTRRRLEGELRREDRLRTIGRLTANLAHEIRNPLNSIRLSMQSLEQRLARNTARRENLKTVIGEVDRLNTLLTQLLAFDNKQAPQMRLQPLTPVVWQCVQLLESEACARAVYLLFSHNAPELYLSFDAAHLTQVITNVILNALQASPIGESVTVGISSGKVACLEISDQGPGISVDQREHLFEAFYTTRPNGTGLGLAVSRELIEGMGGSLYYRHVGPGATFVIELPHDEKNSLGR